MSAKERSLSQLRDQIDEIDTKCHDLLMERTLVVREIALAKTQAGQSGAKTPALAMRPGREAVVLRRLMARHRGALPPGVVAGMWRALIAAKTRLQGPLSVSVYGAESALKYWDLARFQYGAVTPMEMAASAQEVLEAVSAEPGRIGVLPAPGISGRPAPWWPALCAKNAALRVIAGLPFIVEDAEGRVRPQALVVACMAPEPSGDDRTLLAVTFDAPPAAPSVARSLAAAGLQDVEILDSEGSIVLASVSGFIEDISDISAGLRAAATEGVRQINVIGAFASPIKLETRGQNP